MVETQSKTWAIIGMGMGGKGLAAELGLAGYHLRVHDTDEDQIHDIGRNGGLKVQGRPKNFAPVELATTNLAKAVKGASVIIVCTWGTEHAKVAKQLAPLLEDGQLILLIQGSAGGALVVRNELKRSQSRATVDVAEMDGYPYMMRVLAADSVLLTTNKASVQVAALPATRNETLMAAIGEGFPMAQAAPNILYTGLADLGTIFHVAGMLANVSTVESDRDYHFYGDGMTPSVVRLVLALDVDRVAVARAYGIDLPNAVEWMAETFGVREKSLYETIRIMARTHFLNSPCPHDMGYRFLSQDLPCGTLTFAALGDAAGLETPTLDGAVAIGSALTGIDFWKSGRNLENLGLAGKSVEQILEVVNGERK